MSGDVGVRIFPATGHVLDPLLVDCINAKKSAMMVLASHVRRLEFIVVSVGAWRKNAYVHNLNFDVKILASGSSAAENTSASRDATQVLVVSVNCRVEGLVLVGKLSIMGCLVMLPHQLVVQRARRCCCALCIDVPSGVIQVLVLKLAALLLRSLADAAA